MMIKIICTQEEKEVLIATLNESLMCPFTTHYCYNEQHSKCHECIETNINWEVKYEDIV